jgi:hypothetical protein
MKVVQTALREIYGLFVDDGSYALAILFWLLIVGLVFPRLPGGGSWRGPLLFLGLIVLLLENVRRSARK